MNSNNSPGLRAQPDGKDAGIAVLKTINESMCGGYHFEFKEDKTTEGSRALYYYKEGHTLLISHFVSNRVHLLDLETGKLRWFDHHGTTVRSITVCNREIITASWDGNVCVTYFDSLKLRIIMSEYNMGRCPHVSVSPDKNFLYSFSYDSDKNPNLNSNAVRGWALTDGKLIRKFRLAGEHMDDRLCGCSEVYDNKVYITSDTGYLHIYDCISGVLLFEEFYNDPLHSLCLFPAFDLLILGGGAGTIYLCDLTGRRIRKIRAHGENIPQLVVHRDKPDLMISISFDGTMNVWKLPDLELMASFEKIEARLWNVTSNDNLIIAGGENIVTRIYDIKNLSQPRLKGKMHITNESFVFISGDSDSFYTNDISLVKVVKNDDGTTMEGLMAEYLLNTSCNLKVLRDLFQSENTFPSRFISPEKGMLQITQ